MERPTRKLTFGGAVSLDGFLARSDDSFDWIRFADESAREMAAFWKTVDTVLMGRRTWDVAVRHGRSGGTPGVTTHVFSRTLREDPGPTVRVVREDPVEFVRRLKRAEGRDVYLMGGGALAHPLLEAGLVDELAFNVHPVLLGSGVPLFHRMDRQLDLELVTCRPLTNGCVQVTYRVEV